MKYFLSIVLMTFSYFYGYSQDTLKNIINYVHDGDTYHIKAETPKGYLTIRPLGFDCPEIMSNHITADQPMGREIADSVKLWLKGKSITIVDMGLDKFGRTVGIVSVGGLDIAPIILANGWAWYRTDKKLSLKTRRKYQRARTYAQKNKLGIWSTDSPIEPSVWRKKHWR